MFRFGLIGGLLSVPAVAQPQIPFKSRELEEGKNFVQRLTTSLTVGESTGQLSTAYPIAIPAGRGVTLRGDEAASVALVMGSRRKRPRAEALSALTALEQCIGG